jgi:hypothetical protein
MSEGWREATTKKGLSGGKKRLFEEARNTIEAGLHEAALRRGWTPGSALQRTMLWEIGICGW